MIDTRFDTRPSFLVIQDREIDHAASKYLAEIGSLKPILAAVGKWWISLKSEFESEEELILGRMPQNLLPSANITLNSKDLLLALDRVANGKQDNHYIDRAAAMLIGQSIAMAILKTPSQSSFNRAENFLQIEFKAISAFRNTFAGQIEEASRMLRNRWVSLLRLKKIKLDNFRGYREYTIEWLEERVREFQTAHLLDLFELWEGIRHPFRIPSELRNRLVTLASIDRDALISSLEMLPLPGITESAMQEIGIPRDSELILDLIKGAPELFDSKGFWNKGKVAGFLPELVFEFADGIKRSIEVAERQDLFRAKIASNASHLQKPPTTSTADVFSKQEMTDWFRSAFQAILKRKDGNYLLRHFCVYLIYLQRNKSDFAKQDDSDNVAINIINELLMANEPEWTKYDLLEKRNEFISHTKADRGYYVLVASALLDDGATTEKWKAYLTLLQLRDRNVLSQVNRMGVLAVWQFHILGHILARTSDPIAEFRKAWTDLYDERFYSRFQISHDSLNASVHLASVGWGAVLWLVSENGPKGISYEIAEALWHFIFDRVSELHTIRRHVSSFSAERELSLLFASIKSVFPENWPDVVLAKGDFLRSDPWLAATLSMNLLKNGVSKDELNMTLNNIFGGLQGLRNQLLELQEFGFNDGYKIFQEKEILDVLN